MLDTTQVKLYEGNITLIRWCNVMIKHLNDARFDMNSPGGKTVYPIKRGFTGDR